MTLLKRSMIKIVLSVVAIMVPSVVIVRYVAVKSTMAETQALVSNKIQNYSGQIASELNSIQKILNAFAAVFYEGVLDTPEETLKIFTNFTTLYPQTTGFYGEILDHYYDGTLWVPDADYIPKERPWYKTAIQGNGKVVFCDLYLDAQTNTTITSVTQEIKDHTGLPLGVVALDYPLASVEEIVHNLLHPAGMSSSGEKIFILTDSGSFAVSEKYSVDDKIATVANGAYSLIAQKLLSGNANFEKANIDGAPYFFNSTKISGTTWVLVVAEPQSQVYAFSREISILLVSSFFILTVLILILIAATMQHISNPLKTTASALSKIATGSADLTKRLDIYDSSDELKLIRNSFNDFIAHLQSIITEINGTKVDLSSYDENLDELVNSNTTFVRGMVGSIENVAGEITTQNEKVRSTVVSSGEISEAVEALNSLLGTQTQSVQNASEVVTQMVESIKNVSESVEKMTGEFASLQLNVSKGIETQNSTNQKIKDIEEQSKMLNDANIVISSIAEQTNLLAMNAGIEAAHAGESGKGFAVVANEIKKLSETSATQSKKIGVQLSYILEAINGAVKESATSNKVFSEVSQRIGDTGSLVKEISNSMHEQTASSTQISQSLSEMNNATSQVQQAAEQVENARSKIASDVGTMATSSDSVHNSLEEMKAGMERIKNDNTTLLDLSHSINTSINRINAQIGQFEL